VKYFPLRDPLSDAIISSGGRDFLVVTLFIKGDARGMIRVHHAELADFLNLIAEPVPIAEYDVLFDTGVEWFRDYDKEHVISSDGVIVHKDDIP
jgi:hypothetical protein